MIYDKYLFRVPEEKMVRLITDTDAKNEADDQFAIVHTLLSPKVDNVGFIDGAYTLGTYLWIEVQNRKRPEAKIVEGPYIHHCVGIHGEYVPALYEACKYIGVKPDLYDNNEEEVKAFLRGE